MNQLSPEQLLARVRDAHEQALRAGGQDVLAAAQRNVPVATGDLRASGTSRVRRRGDVTTVTVAFDDPAAVVVHEDLQAQHPRGGRAKFLERAATERTRALQERLLRQLRALR